MPEAEILRCDRPRATIRAMATSRLRLRLTSSETRDLADQARHEIRLSESDTWPMNNSTFFTVFAVIAGGLTIAVLVLR